MVEGSPLNIHLKTFCQLGDSNSPVYENFSAIRGNAKGLVSFVKGLDPYDAQTSRTIVLTTYQSLQGKVLDKGVKYERDKRRTREEARQATGADESANDDESEGEDDELDDRPQDAIQRSQKDIRKGNSLKVPKDLFSVRVSDEAHRIKDENSNQTDALYRFEDVLTILLTATPYKNSVKDFYGLLRFMFVRLRAHYTGGEEIMNELSYMAFRRGFAELYDSDTLSIPEAQRREYLRGLDPARFRELAGGATGANSVLFGVEVVPLPSSIAILKQVKVSKLHIYGQDVVIGAGILPYRITNVELRQSGVERVLYLGFLEKTKAMPTEPIVNFGEEDGEKSIFNNGSLLKRRRMILASCNPMLDQLAERHVNTNATIVHKM